GHNVYSPQCRADDYRSDAAWLHRRNRRTAAGFLDPVAYAAERTARRRPAARNTSGEGDVAACVRPAETGSDAGARGSRGQCDLQDRLGIVLWSRRLTAASARVARPAS